MAVGDLITAEIYNAIRADVISIIGNTDDPPVCGELYDKRGYGQVINSIEIPVPDPVASGGQTISAKIWNDLRLDLMNVKIHQDGVLSGIVPSAPSQVIRYGDNFPVTSYSTIIAAAIPTRFMIGHGRSAVTKITPSRSHTGQWSTAATCTVEVQFPTINDARYFFNSGGKIRFESVFSANTPSPVNTAWTNLLDMAGTLSFGATTPTLITYYELTDECQVIHQERPAGLYSSGMYYQISAWCDVENNQNGCAQIIWFKIEWVNGETANWPPLYPGLCPPLHPLYPLYPSIYSGSEVNGTLFIELSELKATGPIYTNAAGSQFTINGPSMYNVLPISAM